MRVLRIWVDANREGEMLGHDSFEGSLASLVTHRLAAIWTTAR